MAGDDQHDPRDARGYLATIPAPRSDEPTSASEGALLAGKYRLGQLLAEGPGRRIYEANQTTLARTVAIRLLTADADPLEEKRTLAEARLLAQLSHPNVLEVYELGVHEGRPFVAMELLRGGTLRDRLDEGPLPLTDAARVGEGILNALHAAHDASVVHRGLTPTRVFLTDKRGKLVVKLADLGVRAEANPRLDLYAAGVVLYEVLTGRLPFAVVDIERDLNDAFTRPPPGPSELNPELGLDADAFTMRALAESREERFQSAVEMLDAWCSISALEPYMNA